MPATSVRCLILLTIVQANVLAAPSLEETREELHKLLEITTKNSNRAVTTLQNEDGLVRQLADASNKIGTNLIQRENILLTSELATIFNKTTPGQVNVTACFQSASKNLALFTDLTHLELDICINRYTNQATTVISQGLGNLNTIVTEAFLLEKRLNDCQDADVNCISYVNSLAQFQQIDIPRRIQELLNSAEIKVEDKKLYLEDCGIKVAQNLVRYGSGVVAEVERCLDETIHPPNTKSSH